MFNLTNVYSRIFFQNIVHVFVFQYSYYYYTLSVMYDYHYCTYIREFVSSVSVATTAVSYETVIEFSRKMHTDKNNYMSTLTCGIPVSST